MNHQSSNLASNYHHNHNHQMSQYSQSQSHFNHHHHHQHHYNGSAANILHHTSSVYRGSSNADLHMQSRDMSEDGDQLLDEEDEDEDEDEENTERPMRRALSQASRSRSVSPSSHDDYHSKPSKHKRQKLEAISPKPHEKASLIPQPQQPTQSVLQSQFNSIYGQHGMFPHPNGFLNAYAAIAATEPHAKSSFVSPLSLIPPLPLPGLLPAASLPMIPSSSSSSSLVRPTVVKPKKFDISNIESLIESSSPSSSSTTTTTANSHDDSDIKYRPDNSLTSSVDVSSNTNESSSSSSCNNSPTGANRSETARLTDKNLPAVHLSSHGMPPHLLWYLYALGSQSVAAGNNSPAEMERLTAAALAAFGCGSAGMQTPLQLSQSNSENQNENLTVSTTNLKVKSTHINESKHRVQPYSISSFKPKHKHSAAALAAAQSDLEEELMNKTDESMALNESMKNDDSFAKYQEPDDGVDGEEEYIGEGELEEEEEDKETPDQSVSSVGDESTNCLNNNNLENHNNVIVKEMNKSHTLNNGGSCQDESCNSSLSVESSLSSSVCLNDSLISPNHNKDTINFVEKNDENSN